MALLPRMWREGLHRRNFISSRDEDGSPADRIQLVAPHTRPSLLSDSFVSQLGDKSVQRKILLWAGLAALLVCACAVSGALLGGRGSPKRTVSDPETPLPPSPSRLRVFRRAAVCTDGEPCSVIGREVLVRNGTAIDATVAAAFCNGLYNMASMGIGGGFFMTVYIKSEERAYSVVARETAPSSANEDMFVTASDSKIGGLAVGVPGEVKGLHAIHQRWGRLPWQELLAPSIAMCHNGFNMSRVLYSILRENPKAPTEDPNLRKMFYSEKDNKFLPAGSLVRPWPTLCATLETISRDPEAMYTGDLAAQVAADVHDAGGIITTQDLANYTAKISDPIRVELANGDVLYTPPPPSSGLLVGEILNILSGYKLNPANIADVNSTVLTYHRIIEAYKYAYATRTRLGDLDYLPELSSLISKVTAPAYAAQVRANISDTRTYSDPRHYGAQFHNAADNGTAHISIVAPNGDAVSLTSSVNVYFGASFTGRRTGIIFNNVMDDFSTKRFPNYFNIPPSPANFIRPGKRPLSSMSPSVLVDRDNNARIVIGASGGSKIISAVAGVIANTLWLGRDVKQAVDAPRIHHQLVPPTVEYEYGNLQNVVEGLKSLGHNMTRYSDRGSVVCAVFVNRTAIYANADHRKGGEVYGLD